jgi:hypothetical protein
MIQIKKFNENIEDKLSEYVLLGQDIPKDFREKRNEKILDRWNTLIDEIKDYYKKELTNTFKNDGIEKTKKLFYDIKSNTLLTQSNKILK